MLTGVLRQARRRAAVNAYLEAGWPIAPGAWWDPRAEQYRCRKVGCLTAGTIHAADGMTPRCDASAWADDPATVLLVTGHGIDVVELPLGSTPPEAIFSRALIPGPVALWASVRPRLLLLASTTGGGRSPTASPRGCPRVPCCTARARTCRCRRRGCARATSCGCARRRPAAGRCPTWARSSTSSPAGSAPLPNGIRLPRPGPGVTLRPAASRPPRRPSPARSERPGRYGGRSGRRLGAVRAGSTSARGHTCAGGVSG